MLKLKTKIATSAMIVKFALIPAVALATAHDKILIDTPEKVEGLFNTIADWFFTVFLIVAVIGLIYTAFMYLTAAGDMDKIKKARTSLVYSIVAIVIALLAGSMPDLIENILRNSSTGSDPFLSDPCFGVPPGETC